MFIGLDDVLNRLEQVEQSPWRVVPRLGDTSDTSGDEIDADEPWRRMRPRRNYKLKNAWGPVVLVSFLWLCLQILQQTTAIFVAVFVLRTSLFWLMVITKNCDTSTAACIFLATNVWGWRSQAGKCWTMRGNHESCRGRVTAVENNEGCFGRTKQGLLFWRLPCQRDWCCGPQSWIMAKVSSLFEFLHLGWNYELVHQLWVQFSLSAVLVNVDTAWSRDEVLVSISFCPVLLT